jgi:hypothetical protein
MCQHIYGKKHFALITRPNFRTKTLDNFSCHGDDHKTPKPDRNEVQNDDKKVVGVLSAFRAPLQPKTWCRSKTN